MPRFAVILTVPIEIELAVSAETLEDAIEAARETLGQEEFDYESMSYDYDEAVCTSAWELSGEEAEEVEEDVEPISEDEKECLCDKCQCD